MTNSNLPKTETISYYDVETDQNLTKEEWNKLNFLNKEDMTISQDGHHAYISEKAFNKGIAMYGPGFWEDLGGVVVKTVATTAAAGVIVATAGTAAPAVGGVMWLGGKSVEEIGKNTDNKVLRSVGSFTKDTGFGTVLGFASTAEGVTQASLKYGWEVSKVEKFNKMIDLFGYAEATKNMAEHEDHKSRGIRYDRNCDVCNL